MTMLPVARKATPSLSGRASLSLAMAVVAALAIPTVYVSRVPAAAPDSSEKSAPPDAVQPEADSAGAPVRVELPGGGVMELVAVGEHPSTDGQFWTPDGLLTQAPYATFRSRVNSEHEIVREFAMRWIDRPPPGGTVQWNVTGGGSGADGPKPLDADGKVVRDLEVSAKAFPQGTKTCNVAIDVATGPWKTLAATVGANPGSSGDGKHGFAFSPTFAAGDKIILTVSHNVLEQDTRVAAVDRDGKTIAVGASQGGGAGRFVQITATFNAKALKDVPHQFELQARPMRDLKSATCRSCRANGPGRA